MPEWVTEFLDFGWQNFLLLAAAVAAIAGFIGNVGKIKDAWNNWRKGRKERRELPAKLLERMDRMSADYACMRGDVTAMRDTLNAQGDKIRELHQQNDVQCASIGRLEGEVSDLKSRVTIVDKLVGNIMCSQLVREHDYYMQKGHCPSADKARLDEIYEEYKNQGRNHLIDHFMDDVLSLPETL